MTAKVIKHPESGGYAWVSREGVVTPLRSMSLSHLRFALATHLYTPEAFDIVSAELARRTMEHLNLDNYRDIEEFLTVAPLERIEIGNFTIIVEPGPPVRARIKPDTEEARGMLQRAQYYVLKKQHFSAGYYRDQLVAHVRRQIRSRDAREAACSE